MYPQDAFKWRIFMAVVNVTAFFICLFMLAYFWKESLVEIFPVFTCMLVLLLYVLAFFHRLDWIDGIGVFIIVLFSVWLAGRKREERQPIMNWDGWVYQIQGYRRKSV